MDTVRARLAGLIEFVKQTALMQKRPALTVSQHSAFSATEEKLRALPGVSLDVQSGDDEVWLRLERLHETKPPTPLSPLLALWMDLTSAPQTEPILKLQVARELMLGCGALSDAELSRLTPDALQLDESTPLEEWVNLEDCLDAGEIKAQFKSYCQTAWRRWSVEEKQRRKSIELYAELFLLVQQIPAWFKDASVLMRDTLRKSMLEWHATQIEIAKVFADIKPIEQFAEPLLKGALVANGWTTINPKIHGFKQVRLLSSAVLFISNQQTRLIDSLAKFLLPESLLPTSLEVNLVSSTSHHDLLQAALQNFESAETVKGGFDRAGLTQRVLNVLQAAASDPRQGSSATWHR